MYTPISQIGSKCSHCDIKRIQALYVVPYQIKYPKTKKIPNHKKTVLESFHQSKKYEINYIIKNVNNCDRDQKHPPYKYASLLVLTLQHSAL